MGSWVLIHGGTVIDGTGAAAVDGCNVLVRDDTIEAVGTGVGDDLIPRGDDVVRIDATGKTVMPGLIDAHCHTSFGEARMQEEQDLYTSHEVRTLRSAWNVTKVLRAGVTGISDPGGSYFIGVGIREGIAEGLIQGPRMTTSGRFLSTSNGISDWYPSSVGVPDSSIGKVVNTADEMVTEVRHQVKNGVDLIKIGDSPLIDIRVLCDKKRIETVILRGEVQVFDDEVLAQRRPYDRAQHICPSDITHDLVFNGGEATQADPRDFDSNGDSDLLAQLDDLAATAAQESSG
jgi:imidazolonepropionase-like amidohydrolase